MKTNLVHVWTKEHGTEKRMQRSQHFTILKLDSNQDMTHMI